jgi:hypothetical protein
MDEKLRFDSFEELEKLVVGLPVKSYIIIWDNDDAEDYSGWIELYQ